MFRVKPKPGSLHYDVELSTNKDTDRWEPKRRIYFTAEVDGPAKIYLATGQTLRLMGRDELTPVWVTVWDRPGTDKVDGCSSYIHVSDDASQPHVTISIHLEPAQFAEALRDLRDGKEVSFSVGEHGNYMFGSEPRIIAFHQPSYQHDGDCLDWRNDLKQAIAVTHVTINVKFGEAVTKDVADEPFEDVQSAQRWYELASSIQALGQSIAGLQAMMIAGHRETKSRLTGVVVLLALIATEAWFRR